MKLARDVKNFKKGFFRSEINKQKEKENTGPQLKQEKLTVTSRAEKAEKFSTLSLPSQPPSLPALLGP